MAEILAEDSGVIRCICEFDHDDNFTIQCERCNAWQHAKCVDITDENAVPDNYLCPDCSERVVKPNKEKARNRQLQFLQQKAELSKQKPRAKNNEDALEEEKQDDRRRRGSRKRSLAKEVPEKSQEVEALPPFDASKFGIPIENSTWTPKAASAWSALIESKDPASVPILASSKDTRGLSPPRIVRRSNAEDNWTFGVGAGKVVATTSFASNKPICEIVGEVMLREEYVSQATNQFEKLGCPKQGVIFVPGTLLAVDTRRKGSQSALFISRSSQPNARVVTRRDSKDRLRILLYSRQPIKQGAELSIGWHWPEGHPVREFQALEESKPKQSQITSEAALASARVIVSAIMWLLNTSLEACIPTEPSDEEDEDWEIPFVSSRKPMTPAPPRRLAPAKKLSQESVDFDRFEDPQMALPAHVWVPTPQDIAPPPKKRMSLKDYMRKRT